jgi:hypothetical protein
MSFFPWTWIVTVGLNIVFWVIALVLLARMARALESVGHMMEIYLEYLPRGPRPPHAE